MWLPKSDKAHAGEALARTIGMCAYMNSGLIANSGEFRRMKHQNRVSRVALKKKKVLKHQTPVLISSKSHVMSNQWFSGTIDGLLWRRVGNSRFVLAADRDMMKRPRPR
jgi:hypothetical protein